MLELQTIVKPYDPSDWYWLKADGRLFSSARIAIVPATDETYLEWVATDGVPTPYPVDTEGNESTAELQAVLDPYGLHATLAHYAGGLRWEAQVAGVPVSVGGGTYHFATDADGRASLNETLAVATNYETTSGTGSFRTAWKTLDGFTKNPLTLSDLQTVGIAVGNHVLGCFATEADVDAELAAGTMTTKEQVEAAFAPPED
jgi:hypothetical protein